MSALNDTNVMFPSGDSTFQELVRCVLLQISGIVAVIGNLFVMSVIICNRSLHTPSNILVFNLALIDKLTGIFLIIASAFYIEGNIDMYQRLIHGVTCMWVCLSIFNLLFIGVDRLLSLSFPFKYTNVNDRVKSCAIVGAIWVLGETVFVFGSAGPNFGVMDCGEFLPNANIVKIIRAHFQGAILLISVMIHIRVYFIAANHTRKIAQTQTERQGQSATNVKAIKTTLIVLGAFCVCYLPAVFVKTSMYYCSPIGGENAGNVSTLAIFVLYSGCTVNPVIYTLRREEFKNQMKRVLNICVPLPNKISEKTCTDEKC